MNAFDTNGLNKEQKEAVLHYGGPLLIIAGAGTGKTHVITSRILHLLLNKKDHHSSVLALTFTEKASEEMIERIDRALPYSYDEIAIKTFHGFCDKILRENGLEIGLDTAYGILTQVDQWMFIKKHLFEFELDYYRPLGNPKQFISALSNHFSRLKDEDISPNEYMEYAKNYLDTKEKEDEEISEKKRLLELANAYETYQRLLIENNFLDFNDLNYFVLRLFEKRPKVLQEYQNTFENILVDEFQDTNYAQSKIVFLLAGKHKNITVVGDDDQSIYRWRGASMNTIKEFEKHFSPVKKIVLKENYRSTSPILKASYELIQNNNPHRLEYTHKINKSLISQSDDRTPVSIHQFSHYFYENLFISEKILEFIQDNHEKHTFNDFAILVRAHNHAKSIIKELEKKQIPFQVKNRESVFSFSEIKDLIAVISFLANKNDDISLFRILKIKDFDISMEQITEHIQVAKTNNDHLYKIIRNDGTNDKLKKIVNILDNLLEFQKTHSVSAIIAKFLHDSLYVKNLQKEESYENHEKIIHIADFLRTVQEFENDNRNNSIYGFLDYIELLEQAGAPLERSTEEIDSDAVQILSVHSAKGLEFPFVFIPSVVKNRFPGINRKDPIEIPDALVKEELPHENLHLHEERRLFYVACTRAKNRLFITNSTYYEGKRKWKPSQFIHELEESDSVKYTDHTNDAKYSNDNIINDQNSSKVKEKPLQTNINVQKKNKTFKKLSFSKIDTFNRCPLKFKFKYIYKIPSPESHASNFGTSIHNTLKQFYDHLMKGNEVFLELMQNLYEKNWISQGYESKAHENARKKKGYEILTNYYKENSKNWIVPIFIEKPFNLKIADYTLTGRIDRIDKIEDDTCEIIDYKTGKLKKNINLKKDLQLSIYALAGQNAYNLPISKLSLYYLENNKKVHTERTNEQLDKACAEIQSLANKINEGNYKATPGHDCQYCEYRRICNKAKI